MTVCLAPSKHFSRGPETERLWSRSLQIQPSSVSAYSIRNSCSTSFFIFLAAFAHVDKVLNPLLFFEHQDMGVKHYSVFVLVYLPAGRRPSLNHWLRVLMKAKRASGPLQSWRRSRTFLKSMKRCAVSSLSAVQMRQHSHLGKLGSSFIRLLSFRVLLALCPISAILSGLCSLLEFVYKFLFLYVVLSCQEVLPLEHSIIERNPNSHFKSLTIII